MGAQVRQSNLFSGNAWQSLYQGFSTVNYNAYDFDTIRAALVQYMMFFYPEDFDDYINSSEFIALIDLLSYLGQSLSFRMDLNVRENFITDAERRASLLKLATFLSYIPSRNNCASGLIKLISVSTTDNIIDSFGNNLSNQVINFNDANNPDWLEQFILILNAAFIPSNPFGKPINSGTVNSIPTQLYQINSVAGAGIEYPFTASIDGTSTDFEIVNTNFISGMTFFENTPNPNNSFNLVYQSDGNGYQSPNTGFFVLFKQGDLNFQDFQISYPIVNRILTLTATGINNTDVWVQTVLDTGAVSINWTLVPSVYYQNIIFNNIPTTVSDICSVITLDNDGVSIRFADGVFGALPTGIIRVWYRTSNGQNILIQPQDIPSVQISIPYLSSTGLQQTLGLTFSLQTNVINSAPSETNDSIRTNAPQIYYTRNRMVNGEDYNVFPLSSPLIMQAQAINRTYSGHSRFIDINDPTGLHQDVKVFSNDGIIYQEFDTEFNEIALSSNITNTQIVLSYIQPMISNFAVRNFFYSQWANFIIPISPPNYIVWCQAFGATNINTGTFILLNGSPTAILPPALNSQPSLPIGVNNPAITEPDYMIAGALLKFNNAGWVSIQSVTNFGVGFNSNGVGNVVLSQPVSSNDYVVDILPAFDTTLTSTEIANIVTQLGTATTFGIRYDVTTGTWIIITGNNLNQNGPFSLQNAGNTSGNNSDASWLVKVLYTGLSWQITTRTLNYYFESVQDVRFFFISQYQIIDQNTGLSVYDAINVLGTNSKPISAQVNGVSQAILNSGGMGYSQNDVGTNLTVVGGTGVSAQITISQVNSGTGTGPITEIITTPAILGAYTINPGNMNIATKGGSGSGATLNLFFEVVSSLPITQTQQFNIVQDIIYPDGYVEPRRVIIEFANTNNDGIPNNPESFLTIVGTGVSYVYWQITTSQEGYEELVPDTDIITWMNSLNLNGLTILENEIIFFVDLLQFYQSVVNQQFTTNVSLSSVIANFTLQSNYIYRNGRNTLFFEWIHNAPIDQRIDPAITNIIDIYVLTTDYNSQIQAWQSTGMNPSQIPSPPTSNQLDYALSGLDEYKMVSDEIIWHPVQYKFLFGPTADPELQGQFQVVMLSQATLSPGQVQSQIISLINDYFAPNLWQTGETFYFSELAAYIQQQLATQIATIVLVPLSPDGQFGDLYQISSTLQELFLPVCTVDSVVIVPTLTLTNLRIGGL